jgi:hypothetical protein
MGASGCRNRQSLFVVRDVGRRPLGKEEITMRYIALLGGDESAMAQPGTPEWDSDMKGYQRFGEIAATAIVAGEALEPAATATTVRHTDGSPLVTAGPFAETAEALGGFYVLDAPTLDDAIELAREIPAARSGWVALRPMVGWWDYAAGTSDAAAGQPAERPAEGIRYLALMYGKESDADQPDTPAWDVAAAAHGRFVESAGQAVLAGAALHPLSTTTTVQVRDAEVLVTDGPFAESAEIAGGLYLLRAPTTGDAVALAQAIPVNPEGAVELRPIMELNM